MAMSNTALFFCAASIAAVVIKRIRCSNYLHLNLNMQFIGKDLFQMTPLADGD